jgi:hypothetical protein
MNEPPSKTFRQRNILTEISGVYGDEYEDKCLLGFEMWLYDGESKHLRNVGQFLPECMTQHPIRQ